MRPSPALNADRMSAAMNTAAWLMSRSVKRPCSAFSCIPASVEPTPAAAAPMNASAAGVPAPPVSSTRPIAASVMPSLVRKLERVCGSVVVSHRRWPDGRATSSRPFGKRRLEFELLEQLPGRIDHGSLLQHRRVDALGRHAVLRPLVGRHEILEHPFAARTRQPLVAVKAGVVQVKLPGNALRHTLRAAVGTRHVDKLVLGIEDRRDRPAMRLPLRELALPLQQALLVGKRLGLLALAPSRSIIMRSNARVALACSPSTAAVSTTTGALSRLACARRTPGDAGTGAR